jgi:hypothetical protein
MGGSQLAKATVNEYTRRQAQALRELRERLGLTEMQVASRLWFKTSQAYQLYEQAKSVIRLDQVPLWATAFGISEREFLEGVVLAAQRPYNPRAVMEASGVVSPQRIDQVEADVAGKPEPAQRARVEGEIALGPDPDATKAESEPDRRRRTG